MGKAAASDPGHAQEQQPMPASRQIRMFTTAAIVDMYAVSPIIRMANLAQKTERTRLAADLRDDQIGVDHGLVRPDQGCSVRLRYVSPD